MTLPFSQTVWTQPTAGLGWWPLVDVAAALAAALHKPSSSFNAFVGDLAGIAAVQKQLLAAFAGTDAIKQGAIVAALHQLSASLAGGQAQTGVLHATELKLIAALSGIMHGSGVLTSQLHQLSAAALGSAPPTGALAARQYPLSALLSGFPIEQGRIVPVMLPLKASLNAAQTQQGSIAVTGKKLTAAASGAQTQSGSLAALLKRFSTAWTATEQPKGTIATSLKKPATALAGQQAQSGGMAAVLKQAVWASTGTQVSQADYVDNFNRTNSTTSLGSSNWTAGVSVLGINSNGAYPVNVNASLYQTAYWNTPVLTDQHEVILTLGAATGSNGTIAAAVGCDTAGNVAWALWNSTGQTQMGTGTNWWNSSFTRTTKTSLLTGQGFSVGDTFTLKRTISGGIATYTTFHNATQQQTWTDSTGIIPVGSNNRILGMGDYQGTSGNYYRIDQWEGKDV